MKDILKAARIGRSLAFDRRTAITTGLISMAMGKKAFAHSPPSIVQTAQGRVRGTLQDSIEVFKGIPYAASTGEANRFLPPQPVTPWAGIRDANKFGNSAPQTPYDFPGREVFSEIETISEDCLSLNVYTQNAARSVRRPVMVWLHGGGWRFGAGSAPGLRGTQLVKDGQVVLVTINHRLDMLGFLQLDDGDERFATSGNVGVLDMIAALKWVRENIEAFGGDPGNVTIFGQSGGAAKVAALLATDSACGLFHKAIAMSGSGCLRITSRDEAAVLAHRVAKTLELKSLTGEYLQSMRLERLIAAVGGSHRPILDGHIFTRHPFDLDFPDTVANIPLLIGNVATETRGLLAAASPGNFKIDAVELSRRVARFLRIGPMETQRIVDAYRKAYRGDLPGDLLGAITSDYIYVRNTRRMADIQSRQAAVFSYMFMRPTPVHGGLLRVPHEAEVPFVFGTASKAESMVGAGPDIQLLTRQMITTWATFAHTGNPNNASLPKWPQHAARTNQSMRLNVLSSFGEIPGVDARAILDDLPYFEYNMAHNYA